MTPTLVRQHLTHADEAPRVDLCTRARDWSEIQERMLVPLYEAVYERLEVGPGTRLLGLGCGSGLALLMAVSRGAAVTGVDRSSPERLALARERLLPDAWGTRVRADARLMDGSPEDAGASGGAETPAYSLVTAFEPIGCLAGDSEGLGGLLQAATPLVERGAPVVLAGWGPPERCATSSVLRVATRLADPLRSTASWRPALRDDLEEVARRAGLKPDGSGRVACPFGYAGMDSAVRGLLSTGLFDAAISATDQAQVDKELTEALHPYLRTDGTVWMPNVFRYLVARTP
ncbi:class I SAM-dependent methyltransferase [Streptomyces sp. NBC_00847]|uniref:class I SAM-dependent methyltransferase n=1 Tax=unclassified Streptomyces TaxID=2593676 RepID=UPI002259DFDE|nr:class I SAM-dependent methyltransferase [Streptomyces sp. NBC_00847]MCX4883845.1 class I SAM-dependent methyltransferase [Streptomyces sp. NBC_00847]